MNMKTTFGMSPVLETIAQSNAVSTRRPYDSPPFQELEWARINDHEVVIVTKDNKWLREIAIHGDDPFSETMSGPGSKATTRQLLDAAFCAGVGTVNPVCVSRERSLLRYVREVIGSYYLTSTTPPLLRELANRFQTAGRSDLEKFARRFARLEDGDQQMAVDDLQALGYRPQELVSNCTPPAFAMASRDYFAALIRGPEPMDALGYLYALERSSLSITEEDLQEISSILPPGIDAIKCRRHHSGVGGDVAHVKYFIHACSRLPGPDRAHIARATYDAVQFIFSLPTDDGCDDAALEREFSRFRVTATCVGEQG
jgi:hypothetical protein